jgi:hypothetical protein
MRAIVPVAAPPARPPATFNRPSGVASRFGQQEALDLIQHSLVAYLADLSTLLKAASVCFGQP